MARDVFDPLSKEDYRAINGVTLLPPGVSIAPGCVLSGLDWRTYALKVLAEVVAALPEDATDDHVKRAISAAYPFGERKHTPYKIWLEEAKAVRLRLDLNRKGSPLNRELLKQEMRSHRLSKYAPMDK